MNDMNEINVMNDIIFRISRHYITGIIGILGLGVATYGIRRYLSNHAKTTNTFYIRADEQNTIPNLKILSPNVKHIYIYWNGSFNSTYLLLDYLLQDYIIQPLYIECYTIRKNLEQETLQKYTIEYNLSKLQKHANYSSNKLEYLTEIAKIKKKQENEMSQMVILRRVITKQYPEFHANLLPTQYITMIEKDLEYSQKFYDIIRELNLSSLECTGIEFYEQASRYILHLPEINTNLNKININNALNNKHVIMGYSQDSHLISTIKIINQKLDNKLNNKLENNLKNKIENTLDNKFSKPIQNSRYNIDLPLKGISNNTIKYLAYEKINREVLRFLNSTRNN